MPPNASRSAATARDGVDPDAPLTGPLIAHSTAGILIVAVHPSDEGAGGEPAADEATFRIAHANEAYAELTGYAPEEVVGQPPDGKGATGGEASLKEVLRAAYRAGAPQHEEIEGRTASGQAYWAALNVFPVETDEATYLVVEQRDITARKQAENALAEADEALQQRLALEDLVTDTAARFVSAATEALDDEIQAALREVGHYGDLDRCYIYTYEHQEAGRWATLAHEWQPADAAPIPERWRVLDAEEAPAGLVGFARRDEPTIDQDELSETWRLAARSTLPDDPAHDLPRAVALERQFMRDTDTEAHLTLPLVHEGRVIGCFGLNGAPQELTAFLTTRPTRQTLGVGGSDENGEADPDARSEVPLLRLLAEIFGNTLARQSAHERIQASLREKETLLREIHHRVKNNMQVISSLLGLQAGTVDDPATLESLKEARERVRSMAMVHEQLYLSDSLSDVDFAGYIRQLARRLIRAHNPEVDLQLDVDDADLNVEKAVPCGLIINELLTNALEHAFSSASPAGGTSPETASADPTDARPRIRIAFKRRDDAYRLVVQDNGRGLSDDFVLEEADSLGLQLVSTLVHQLDGRIETVRDAGTRHTVTFPVST
jgi:PAS domain S-box-containing protein